MSAAVNTPDSPSSTDEALAASARAGSVRAFEELVRRYQVPLLRFLQRRGPSPREAEDVLQEAFLRAFRSIGQYREGRPFRPWLFTIAYRLAVDAARRPVGPRLAVDDCAPADDRPHPAQQVERSESADRLWATVRRSLGDDAYTAVWLSYVESLRPRHVAAVMGRSGVWVRTVLHRARRQLAAVLVAEDVVGFGPAETSHAIDHA